jgi:hypothetical protein
MTISPITSCCRTSSPTRNRPPSRVGLPGQPSADASSKVPIGSVRQDAILDGDQRPSTLQFGHLPESRGRRPFIARAAKPPGATLVELNLSFPTLPPALNGFRILQITDTHLDALPELATVGAQMLDGLVVDLLVHTGDVLAIAGRPLSLGAEPLGELLARVTVRGRRLAILGNHDPAEMAAALEAAGFEVLLNGSTVIKREHALLRFNCPGDVTVITLRQGPLGAERRVFS